MAKTSPEIERFVVTGAAVTITTGEKRNGKPVVARVKKGTLVTAPAGDQRIRRLLETKCLARYVEGQAIRPATARSVAMAMGGIDDPVKAPISNVQPVTPLVEGVAAV